MTATAASVPLCRLIHETSFSPPRPPSSYPPISSIPKTTPERLAAAASKDSPAAATDSTVLYLAYGSNLSAETFLGARGIRPISQVNVSCPSLTLVFDLPGLPYREPCFANTAPRKIPKLPDPPSDPRFPPIPPPPQPPTTTTITTTEKRPLYDVEKQQQQQQQQAQSSSTPDRGWTKGLYGVVYEVTPEDYAIIVATEGGGSSYADILVPCLPLPPRVSVPEKPPIEIPKPFFAHTLYSPSIPDAAEPGKPDDDDDDADNNNNNNNNNDDNDDNDDDDNKKPEDPRKKWYYRFVKPPRRPDPNYAQPSARYLKLITDGAAEHELPDDYQRWLNGLQAYAVTTCRQQIAQWLLTGLFFPVMLLFFQLNKWLSNKEGKFPLWLGITLSVIFNMLWMGYDSVLKPVFGDGERTQEKKEKKRWRRVPVTDIEKTNLLLRDW